MKAKRLIAGVLAVFAAGFLSLSLTSGQEKSPGETAGKQQPVEQFTKPDPQVKVEITPRLSPLQEQMRATAERATEWLRRVNQPDGHFVNGYIPCLRATLEGDHFLRQAGAAYALAMSGRVLRDERSTATARQAILTLLLDTAIEPKQPGVRRTTMSDLLVNPLGSAAMLVLAINELPAPGDDLLEQSEQLCAFIRSRQKSDGSLRASENASAENDAAEVDTYPGQALYALAVSQRHRPAQWKTEAIQKAMPYYRSWWQSHKSTAFVPWQTAACTESFKKTQDKACAEFIGEMNDWLLDLQYVRLDPRHPLWGGGFMQWAEDRPSLAAPHIGSAQFAWGLADAGQALKASNPDRYERYRTGVERSLQFLVTLQYTEANTQHFAEWYRPSLLGGFHASEQDGTLRIDYTQHAICALLQYLELTTGA
jgi:hypothetical protein